MTHERAKVSFVEYLSCMIFVVVIVVGLIVLMVVVVPAVTIRVADGRYTSAPPAIVGAETSAPEIAPAVWILLASRLEVPRFSAIETEFVVQ